MMHVPNEFRVRKGPLASADSQGNEGCFIIPSWASGHRPLQVIASDGMGWEHVSLCALQGTKRRTPTWDEMCAVKDIFWDAEDCVMQLHPPRSAYVNNHPSVLHLWRPTGQQIPQPPSILVGIVNEPPTNG